MAEADGSVVIGVDLNVDEAEKELARLRKKAISLENSIGKADFRKSKLAEQSAQMAVNLDKAKKRLDEMENAAAGVFSKDEIKEQKDQIKLMQSEWDAIENEIEKCNKTIQDQNAELEYTENRYAQIAQGLTQHVPILDRFGERAKSVFSSAAGLASKFSKTVAKIGIAVLNTVKNMNVFSKLTQKIGPAITKLGSMMRRVFVFSVITSGLRLLRAKLSDYLSVNTELSNALGKLKSVFLTAFQPIYEYIVPAVTALINVITQALAVVAQFVSILFGGTAKQAQKNAKALNAQAEATEAAGAAADDAKKSLAGFDEINKLSSGSSAGGGGASAEEVADAFDYDFDNSSFKSWGEAFSAFLDQLLGGIPKLKETFGKFASWLNEWSNKVFEMFTFPGVREKVVQLGKQLADAFNELVLSIDWYRLGEALGAGLNLALLFLVNFIYTFDWMTLGASLAAMLNGIVSQIDWYAFGQLLWAGWKIAIEMLAGFLLALDMAQLAQAASNIATGFFDSMTDTIQKIDWEGIGHQVKEFLVNVNWADVAQSVFTAIGSAFGAAASFLWGLIQDAWQGVIDWWHEHAEEDGKFTFEGLLSGILEAISGIGTWIRTNIFEPFINGFKNVFGINSPSTVMAEMGGYIIDGLFNGMSGIGSRIASWGSSILSGVKNFFGIHSPSTEFESLGDYMMKGMYNGLSDDKSKVISVFDDMFNAISKLCKNNVALMTNEFVVFLTYMSTEFSNTWSNTWAQFYSTAYKNIRKIISEINALIARLSAIERNITIVITTVHRTVNENATGSSGGGASAASISMPAGVKLGPIPALAQGAVIPPNREFLAVLGDQRSGTNIETPLETMKQAFTEALQEAGITGGNKQEAVFEVGEEVFAKLVYKLMNRESKRIGVSLVEV